MENYNRLFEMLPNEMKPDDRSNMFKDFLKIYGEYADSGDTLNRCYGGLLDVYGAHKEELDFIGAMFTVFRLDFETDDSFKNRIVSTVIERKVPTTIPELQQAIDAIVTNGRLYILENHNGMPCSVYITGTADEESVNRAISLVKRFLPAGIKLIIPVVSFDIWQNIRDQFVSWESLGETGYIW